MDDGKKKTIALLILTSLGVGAYYLLREDLKDIVKSTVKNKPIVKEEKKPQTQNLWEAMTWDKLRAILGPKLRNENLLEAYYLLGENEKMSWRRAVYKRAVTSLDRAFVYLDARIISQVYPTQERLREAVRLYSKNQISFEELYSIYRPSLHRLFGIG